MMIERIKYFTPEPHYSVLEEHEAQYIVGDEGRAIVKVAEDITRYEPLPRWKRMANTAITSLITFGLAYPSVYGADNYIVPRHLRK
jgi:hypothetical protein